MKFVLKPWHILIITLITIVLAPTIIFLLIYVSDKFGCTPKLNTVFDHATFVNSYNLASSLAAVFGVLIIFYTIRKDTRIERNERRKQFFDLYEKFYERYSSLKLLEPSGQILQGDKVIDHLATIQDDSRFLELAQEVGLYEASQQLYEILNWMFTENQAAAQDHTSICRPNSEIDGYRSLLINLLGSNPLSTTVFGRYRALYYQMASPSKSNTSRGTYYADVVIPPPRGNVQTAKAVLSWNTHTQDICCKSIVNGNPKWASSFNIETIRSVIEHRAEDHFETVDESHINFNAFQGGNLVIESAALRSIEETFITLSIRVRIDPLRTTGNLPSGEVEVLYRMPSMEVVDCRDLLSKHSSKFYN